MQNPFDVIESRLSNIESLLTNLAQSNKVENDSPEWMTIDELINYLPEKPSKQTIYQRCYNRTIPHVKNGGKLLFIRSEIDSYLLSKKREMIEGGAK